MKHIGYDLEIDKTKIKLDSELNIDKLGWKNGDFFQLINVNGQVQLVKVDPLVPFLAGIPLNK